MATSQWSHVREARFVSDGVTPGDARCGRDRRIAARRGSAGGVRACTALPTSAAAVRDSASTAPVRTRIRC